MYDSDLGGMGVPGGLIAGGTLAGGTAAGSAMAGDSAGNAASLLAGSGSSDSLISPLTGTIPMTGDTLVAIFFASFLALVSLCFLVSLGFRHFSGKRHYEPIPYTSGEDDGSTLR